MKRIEWIVSIANKGEIGIIESAKWVQELIRCKDCKHAHLTYDGECKYCDMDKDEYGSIEEKYRPGDWFCADGERKDS